MRLLVGQKQSMYKSTMTGGLVYRKVGIKILCGGIRLSAETFQLPFKVTFASHEIPVCSNPSHKRHVLRQPFPDDHKSIQNIISASIFSRSRRSQLLPRGCGDRVVAVKLRGENYVTVFAGREHMTLLDLPRLLFNADSSPYDNTVVIDLLSIVNNRFVRNYDGGASRISVVIVP
jgi:hypothetical protein